MPDYVMKPFVHFGVRIEPHVFLWLARYCARHFCVSTFRAQICTTQHEDSAVQGLALAPATATATTTATTDDDDNDNDNDDYNDYNHDDDVVRRLTSQMSHGCSENPARAWSWYDNEQPARQLGPLKELRV